MTEYKVIGPFEVAGKSTGEIVELDPEVINIPALLDGGHIEPLNRPGPTERASETTEES